MSKEIDEDLIEATIRKVAEARAARGQDAGASDDSTDEPADLSKWDDKAAAVDDDAIAATLARIQAHTAPREPEPTAPAGDDLSKWDDKAAAVDDDAIAATIARIQAHTAPREPEPTAPAGDDLSKWDDKAAAVDDDAIAATLARIQAPPATNTTAAAHVREATLVAELQVALEQTIARVAALEAQMASLSATVRSLSAGAVDIPVTSQPAPSDDDWDDVPPPASSGFGAPPRPSILRDPSPWTATAAKLEPSEAPAAFAPPEEEGEPSAQRPRLHAIGAEGAPEPQPQPRSGFDLLPKTYRITVEDKRRNVDLVPLHRALLGIDGVRDMSLLSYANGAAIVSVETLGDLAPETLQRAVAHAMARDAEVQVHNETTMVVKIAEE